MEAYMKRVAAATLLFLGLGAGAPALASGVQVTVSTPKILIAPAALGLVTVQTVRPAPHFVWVAGSWRRDAIGRRIWVPGSWQDPRAHVVVHPAPVPARTVTVIRR